MAGWNAGRRLYATMGLSADSVVPAHHLRQNKALASILTPLAKSTPGEWVPVRGAPRAAQPGPRLTEGSCPARKLDDPAIWAAKYGSNRFRTLPLKGAVDS
ncbi:uncharacterized protein EI90DRAFT_3014911 [Cantharellus anzutake]|uniref:uncharacterized protein n=1 Tax=Cantharellus anzutake TaxID=1750568 RepID=UPI001904187E|nr:uncharacterized protein EI90DRAFT_3014911 [Cantharellus anzutake]KAF8334647.1 hypothetical protein EI90DRAFT_3014911 [Cantharellus anzutake]